MNLKYSLIYLIGIAIEAKKFFAAFAPALKVNLLWSTWLRAKLLESATSNLYRR